MPRPPGRMPVNLATYPKSIPYCRTIIRILLQRLFPRFPLFGGFQRALHGADTFPRGFQASALRRLNSTYCLLQEGDKVPDDMLQERVTV